MASSKKSPAKGKGLVLAEVGHLPALNDPALRAAAAEQLKRQRAVGGNRISIKGKKFRLGGQLLGAGGDTLRVSVVNWSYVKAYFTNDYVEGENVPPDCFALSMRVEDLKPHEKCSDKQNETCAGCPWDAFKSSNKGSKKGKACADKTRLVLLVESDLESVNSVKTGKLLILDVPAKSIGAWTSYSNQIMNNFEREPLTILTEMAFVEGEAYPVLEFRPIAGLGDLEVINAIMARKPEAEQLCLQPWEPQNESAKPAAPRKQPSAAKSPPKRSRFS